MGLDSLHPGPGHREQGWDKMGLSSCGGSWFQGRQWKEALGFHLDKITSQPSFRAPRRRRPHVLGFLEQF